ncbi:efflux RND transporter permease subunit [Cupriavidus basilensis]
MVPLSSLLRVSTNSGPDMVVRYNGYTAADINGGRPRASRRARHRRRWNASRMKRCQGRALRVDGSGVSADPGRQLAGRMWIFPICVLLVFLVLAAQYESLDRCRWP